MSKPRLTDEEIRQIQARFDAEWFKSFGSASAPLARIGSASEFGEAMKALRGDATLVSTLRSIENQEKAELRSFKSAQSASTLAAIQWLKNKWYRQLAAGLAVGGVSAAIVGTGGKAAGLAGQSAASFQFASSVKAISAAKSASMSAAGAQAAGGAMINAAIAGGASASIKNIATQRGAVIERNIKRYYETQRWNATIHRYRRAQRGQ